MPSAARSPTAAPGTKPQAMLDWARKPVTTGPYKVAEFKPRRVADTGGLR